jgi:hypothetical protein
MKIILISVQNFQDYILDNIKNLLLFKNNDIDVITEREYFHHFDNLSVNLIDRHELDDNEFNSKSQLDQNFRNGFWHLCSLRLFYLYSHMKQNNLSNCIHLENNVMTYINFDSVFNQHLAQVYVTYDCENRVIPGIVFIPNHESFKIAIDNYDFTKNDMENLAKHNFESFPIFPSIDKDALTLYNKNFSIFQSIFDAAAIGQYVGGVDPRNIEGGDTRGFVNETCVIKYNSFVMYWIKDVDLFIPHIEINGKLYRINNLHIHCKQLCKFMANDPIEETYMLKRKD